MKTKGSLYFRMDNRGKLWSIDDDQKLMESPQLPNAYFSQTMGRSENAIKFRRSHLAAKMHQNDPSTSIEEYVGLMWGDLEHANQLLQEWTEKRATFKSFLDLNRKRKAQEQAVPAPEQSVHSSRFFPQAAKTIEKTDQSFWDDSPDDSRIKTICQSIREEGGNLVSVFNDSQFIPCLIQNYQGFEAYARIVQARILQQQ
jgi:hypothetical protein